MSKRCPSCGSATPHPSGRCWNCNSHPAPHEPYGRFNPRCPLCWTEVSGAFARSIFIAVWRLWCRSGL